jgi:hypothetical protein
MRFNIPLRKTQKTPQHMTFEIFFDNSKICLLVPGYIITTVSVYMLSILMLVFIFCDIMLWFWVEANLCRFYSIPRLILYVLPLEIQLSKNISNVICKISLKRVEMDFWLGSKNSIIGKTPRKPQDMTELSTNYVTFTQFHW